MENNQDVISTVVILAIAVIIGVVIFANAVIPMSIDAIGSLTGDDMRYNTIMYIVPLTAILGLVVLIARHFTGRSAR